MDTVDELNAKLQASGQTHLKEHLAALDPAERKRLAEQLEQIDLELIKRLYSGGGTHADFNDLVARATSPPAIRLAEQQGEKLSHAEQLGKQALAAGGVAVMLVAGGQGTRLGFDPPKGMYPIGPVSQATLFQIHCEKLLAIAEKYGHAVPLFVMTSPATDAETKAFFDEHDRFGLAADDLKIFCQGTMPAVDAETGDLLLEEKDRLFLSPDGHGGALAALDRSGALAEMEKRGIKQLFYLQVDNPLVPICDPAILGHHVESASEMTTLVVAKGSPTERVGNVVSVDGDVQIIEYSDLPDEAAKRKKDDGSLELWAGNIAVHVFEVDFLKRMAASRDSLPFHIAHKKVPYLSDRGERVEPQVPNALKFERFIFDLLPSAKNAIVIEGDGQRVFAPLKNATGADSATPESVRAQMVAAHREWLEAAGAEVAADVAVEISPRFALDQEDVAKKIEEGTKITEPTYLR